MNQKYKKYSKILYKHLKGISKTFCKITAVIFVMVGILPAMFCFDSGRQILLNGFTKYLSYKGINCEIYGLARDLSTIDKISIKLPEKNELLVNGIEIKKDRMRFAVSADDITLKIEDKKLPPKEEKASLLEQKIAPKINEFLVHFDNNIPYSYLKIARAFVSKIQIKNLSIKLSEKQFFLNNISYLHRRSEDNLSFHLDRIENLDSKKSLYFDSQNTVNMHLNNEAFHRAKMHFSFNKILGFNGDFYLRNSKHKSAEYKLHIDYSADKNATNSPINSLGNLPQNFAVDSYGKFSIPSKEVCANELLVTCNGKAYKTSIKAALKNDYIELKTSNLSEDFLRHIPEKLQPKLAQITKNFKDLTIKIETQYFSKNLIKNKIEFQRKGSNIGAIYGNLSDNILNVCGNLDWLNFYGYQFKNLDCAINDFNSISTTIEGQNFILNFNGKIENGLQIEKADLKIEKNGSITLSEPFSIAKNSPNIVPNLILSFDFNNLDFFNKLAPISGDSKGTFSLTNSGEMQISCNGNHFKFLDYELGNYSASYAPNDVSLNSKSAVFYGIILNDILFKISNGNLQLSLQTPQNATIKTNGKISDSFKQISLSNCSITSDKAYCNVKDCSLNFDNNEHGFVCDIYDTKQKNKGRSQGQIRFRSGSNDGTKTIDFIELRPNIFCKIFDMTMPKCRLDGSLKIYTKPQSNNDAPDAATNRIFGDGHLVITELFCKHNSLEINAKLDNKLNISTILNNDKNIMHCDVSIPVSDKLSDILKDPKSTSLNCHIFGNARLERMFELSDEYDARGLISCDLNISGTFASPQINGTASLKNGLFVIGDIFLRRGDIKFDCSEDNIRIVRAEFKDNQNNKFIATGGGKFFFDDLMPNIDTDVDWSSENYTLFDSGNLNIRVRGNGKITGPIDDMLISGNARSTRCNIRNMGTDFDDSKDGIVIENEMNVPPQHLPKMEEQEKDFCRYDINLHCPNVAVFGSIYEIYFGGDLRLLTNQNRMAALVGSLALKSGKLELFGKKMIIRKGKVEFFEQYPMDPRVFILCENQFGDMIVYLKVKSVPTKGGSFELYSEPNYPIETILSNMLFGKDMRYLKLSEAAEFAHAVASFRRSGGYVFSLLNTLKKSGIVDTISFSTSNNEMKSLNTNTQSSQDSNNLSISAGKYIGDNLFISVNKNADNTTSFDLDYAISPRISIKANTNGEAGISWKYKY